MFKENLRLKITQEELELVQEISVLRPKPNRVIDQIYMKPICMLIQAKLIASYLNNKDLIFMGDGDHQSVLCGLYSRPKSITVLDIDSRIVKNIPKVAGKYNRVKFENRTKSDIISLWNDFELNVQNVLNQSFGKLQMVD